MKRLLAFAVLGFIGLVGVPAHAQTMSAIVVGTCGTPPTTYSAGQPFPLTQDTTGTLCAQGGGGSSTITANSTATSGFSANQLIFSDGSKVQASGGVTYANNALFAAQASLATATATGFGLINSTASTSGVPVQVSPSLNFQGHAWNTTSVAADNFADWQIYNQPVSGATPSTNLIFGSRISTAGSGAFTTRASLSSAGLFLAVGAALSGASNGSPALIIGNTSNEVSVYQLAAGFSVLSFADGATEWSELGYYNSQGSLSLLGTNSYIGLGGTAGNPDTVLVRDAAGTLDLRNGTAAQIFKVSASHTDASNGAWAAIDTTTANTVKFGSYGNGTGASTLSELEFDVLGVPQLTYSGGNWTFASGSFVGAAGVVGSGMIVTGGINFLASQLGFSVGSIPYSLYAYEAGSGQQYWTLSENAHIGWTNNSEANVGDTDTMFSRKSAAFIYLGDQDAASPVAQSFGPQGVAAGNTNVAGATFTIQGSLSNGSGGGDILIKTTLSSAASGTQNTAATALTLKGGTQSAIFASTVQLAGYTIATTLPAAGTAGRIAYVTDQITACAATGVAITGGGALVCPVFDNGAAWVGL